MKKKIRVNVTLDAELLDKAKKKLNLFGGKLSTMFNAYLADFVSSMEKKQVSKDRLIRKIEEMEDKLREFLKEKK